MADILADLLADKCSPAIPLDMHVNHDEKINSWVSFLAYMSTGLYLVHLTSALKIAGFLSSGFIWDNGR